MTSGHDLLEAAAAEPQSAKQLAERCGMSLPTVYRRLELLQEHALVTERTEVAEDGNHYSVYECNFESTVITLDEDSYDVTVYRRETPRASSRSCGTSSPTSDTTNDHH